MKGRTRALIVDSLRCRRPKDQVIKMLDSKCISIKVYNRSILAALLRLHLPFGITGVVKALDTNTFLDQGFLRGLSLQDAMAPEPLPDEETLFEKQEAPTEYYGNTKHLSYRTLGRMLAREEILARFQEYSAELKLSRHVEEGCVESLEMGLETYIRRVAGVSEKHNGEVTIASLRRNLGKHLRLFTGLDIL